MPTDFVDPRETERRNPATAAIDAATPLELVHLINQQDQGVALAVANEAPAIARAVELAEAALRDGHRLLYVGAGTSGRLGVLDAAECPPTFGSDPAQVVGIIAGGFRALVRSIEGAEDDVNAGIAAIDGERVAPGDFVIGIAASGTTPYVRAALGRAQAHGAHTAIVCMSPPPPLLADTCDVVICVRVGPEVVTGSTRLKAGTATKLVLNTISTGAMVRLGKVYGNLMVDLRAWNAKLVDRSLRIIMETTGADRAAAAATLEAAGGEVKVAIVMLRRGVTRSDAESLLAASHGRLRPVVGDPPPVPAAASPA